MSCRQCQNAERGRAASVTHWPAPESAPPGPSATCPALESCKCARSQNSLGSSTASAPNPAASVSWTEKKFSTSVLPNGIAEKTSWKTVAISNQPSAQRTSNSFLSNKSIPTSSIFSTAHHPSNLPDLTLPSPPSPAF